MKAKYEGQCAACLNWIHVGEEIESRELVHPETGEVGPVEWIHARCNVAEEGPLPEFGGKA